MRLRVSRFSVHPTIKPLTITFEECTHARPVQLA